MGAEHPHGSGVGHHRDRETPLDYLDFASPIPGFGGKIGLDATNKPPEETNRE